MPGKHAGVWLDGWRTGAWIDACRFHLLSQLQPYCWPKGTTSSPFPSAHKVTSLLPMLIGRWRHSFFLYCFVFLKENLFPRKIIFYHILCPHPSEQQYNQRWGVKDILNTSFHGSVCQVQVTQQTKTRVNRVSWGAKELWGVAWHTNN